MQKLPALWVEINLTHRYSIKFYFNLPCLKFNILKIFMTLFLLAGSAVATAQIPCVETVKKPVTDIYFGKEVIDDYRWLEDDNSVETKAWVKEQNKCTQAYLEKIPFRNDVKKRLREIYDYPKASAPVKRGEYLYFSKNDGLQNQAVIYRQKGERGTEEVFLDPNKLSSDGTVALSQTSFSKNNKYMAYLVSESGSDWQEARVMDVTTKAKLKDDLKWIKFSGISWKGDEGFYYSRYPVTKTEDRLSGKNENHQVWYHKMGTPQSSDVLIFEDAENPLRTSGVSLTEDGRFLILNVSEGTSGQELLYKDLKNSSQKNFAVLIPGFATEATVVDNLGDRLLVLTNDGAPNFKLVSIDPKNPQRENWQVVIPEKTEALQDVSPAGGFLFATYLKDASSRVSQHTYTGKLVREITLPGIGSVSGFAGKKDLKDLYFSFSSFVSPSTIYKYNLATGKSDLFRKSAAKFDTDQYTTEQVFFTSKDGTKIPMFLSYKKGIQRDGNNPVALYGYGGFNIPITPGFSESYLLFMEQGGIYASVTLRGGNEYGEEWHKAGMLKNKQNVFDDFIGAAEYLIREKYTNPGKIAIRGGSNGGLLVGAALTQRPDLFKVAIPAVGVLDMLRYHKFTIGWAWAVEYGSSEQEDMFPYLYAYSPYHNIQQGKNYPATMVITGDHDDRVVPAHSFKFGAKLQEMQSGDNPILIRIETNAGHGAGKPTDKIIEESADVWSFILYNMGLDFKKN